MTASVDELISSFKKEEDCLKKAKYLAILHRDHQLTLKEIAKKIVFDQSYVSHYLRILKLPNLVIDGYYAKNISCAHLMILSRLDNEKDIIDSYRLILEKSLSTTQTETIIRNKKYHVSTSETRLDPDRIRQMKKKFEKNYPDTKIEILQSRIRGKITIEIKSDTKISSKQIERVFNKLIREDQGETGHESLIELD